MPMKRRSESPSVPLIQSVVERRPAPATKKAKIPPKEPVFELFLVQLPGTADARSAMARHQLLRFILIQTQPEALDYYTQFAARCILQELPDIPDDFRTWLHAPLGETNIYRKLFVILMAVNCSKAFLSWVRQYSSAELEVVDFFVTHLRLHFTYFITCSDSNGKCALTTDDVLYSDLDQFVMHMVRFFVTR